MDAVIERHRAPNHIPPATTKALQRAFLLSVRHLGTYAAACQELGIHHSTVMQWAQKNPALRDKMREYKAEGEEYIGDRIIGHLHKRAFADPKADPMSAQIAMYITKKIFPEYRENAVTNVLVTGPVAIQFNMDALPQVEQARPQALANNSIELRNKQRK